MLSTILLVILILITVYRCHEIRQNNGKNKQDKISSLPFPPGPKGWPFLGNLVTFGKAPLTSMLEWKKQYGPIVGLQLGQFKAVLISDDKLLKEAFNNPAFNGRPPFRPAVLFSGGQTKGTLTSSGETWAAIRRFTIKHLNDLGFGNQSMESLIVENVDEFVQQLQRKCKTTFKKEKCGVDLHDLFYIPTSSSIWYILTGESIRSSKHAHVQESLIKLNNSLWTPIGSPIWFYPSLCNWFPQWTGWRALTEALPPVTELVTEEIKQHLQQQCQQGENCNEHDHHLNDNPSSDLMYAFLRRISNTKDPTSTFYDSVGRNHMQSMILDLFVTAAEAMSNSLCWSILYLSLYPEVQDRLYVEIKDVIGSERTPSLNDQQNMPYAKAVIQELLRISSTSPFSNFQCTLSDVEFHGYFIPKDTVIIGNLYGLHHDESIWTDPETFRPERFLTTSSMSSLPPSIKPFSVGLRTCIGQTYTKHILFLFIISMCQKLMFTLNSSERNKMSPEWLIYASHVSIFRFCPKFKSSLIERT